jgi:1,4-alpha-glucan branching enzyme
MRIPYPLHERQAKRIEAHLLDCVNLRLLSDLCIRNAIEVAHCHLINVDTRYAIALKRLLGIKVVITLRGGEFHHWIAGRPVRRQYVQRMLESADAVTALSQSQMDDARELAPSLAHDSPVIPNPADREAIVRLAAQGTGKKGVRAPYILFAGRLEAQKRVDVLIDAYHGIIAKDKNYKYDLIMAGSGSLSPALQEQARNGPGAGRIRFLGSCRYEDSLAIVRDAALLVLPSQESEGCPNVVLEAMALATPVIVADHGPLAELVAHGVNGEVFPSGDAEALATRLRALAGDAKTRVRYAEAGLRHLNRRHRFDQVANAYEELYGRILSPRTIGTGRGLREQKHRRGL